MPRISPTCRPDAALLEAQRPEPLLDIEVQVVTPLFGGGAVPRSADPVWPVRGASIRGQLRFWWRACVASRYADAGGLFRDEAAIWGTTADASERGAGQSALEVRAEVLDSCTAAPCARYEWRENRWRGPIWRPGYPPYALFPFQGEAGNPERQPAEALEGVRFRLTISLAPHVELTRREELSRAAEAAVWAWVTFGGLGARTRRGCGSLFCDDARFRPPSGERARLILWLRERLGQHVLLERRRLPLPVLAGAGCLLGSTPLPVLQAWGEAIRPMQDFRQQPGFARNPGTQPNRPGRSRWPEADSIRQVLGIVDPRHPPEHPARPYFPRADLGLPIVFQRLTQGDVTLQAAGERDGATRMASPIILKPLAIGPERAVPLALRLEAPHVWEAGTPGVRLRGQAALAPAELHDSARSKAVAPLQPQGTAREAFWAYVEKRWR